MSRDLNEMRGQADHKDSGGSAWCNRNRREDIVAGAREEKEVREVTAVRPGTLFCSVASTTEEAPSQCWLDR